MANEVSVIGGLTTVDGRRPRVAIVGGSLSGSMVAVVLAEQFGCAPMPAPTGEAVLEMLARDTDLDLILIDLAVPGMNALVAAEMARAIAARGTPPVLALVDSGTAQGNTSGFAGTVTKPYSPRELYRAMRAALGEVAGGIAPAAGFA